MPNKAPPGGPGRPVHVLRIPEEDTHRVIFLESFTGQLEHWEKRSTFACPGGEVCKVAHSRYVTHWYGYAACAYLDPRTGRYDPWVLQITSNLSFHLLGRDLRGEVWDLKRAPHRGKFGEVLGELMEVKEPATLPPPFPVQPVLERIFGKGRVYLGAKNPTPVPVLVQEFEIEAPRKEQPAAALPRVSLKEQLDRLKEMSTGKPGVRYT